MSLNLSRVVIWIGGVVGVAGIHEILAQNLTVVANRGAAFGFWDGWWWNLVLIWGVLLLGIGSQGGWGWQVMVAGGIINYWDRCRFGFVRDYWPIPGGWIYNNINDWIVVIGLLIQFGQQWKKRR